MSWPNLGASFEWALTQAIAQGHSWFAGPDTLRKLDAVTDSKYHSYLENITQEIESGNFQLNLFWYHGAMRYEIGASPGEGIASLKEKLAQLPSGSRLILIGPVPQDPARAADIQAVEEAVNSTGLTLVLPQQQ